MSKTAAKVHRMRMRLRRLELAGLDRERWKGVSVPADCSRSRNEESRSRIVSHGLYVLHSSLFRCQGVNAPLARVRHLGVSHGQVLRPTLPQHLREQDGLTLTVTLAVTLAVALTVTLALPLPLPQPLTPTLPLTTCMSRPASALPSSTAWLGLG
jgi:hypothetical protein